jgi:hypothetical protein
MSILIFEPFEKNSRNCSENMASKSLGFINHTKLALFLWEDVETLGLQIAKE